ncbi:MAG: antA/AntB antirepressor family protein [Clostridia bacterium]
MNTNELIKVDTNEKGERLVSARDLHKGLEIGKDFSTWFKDMVKFGFEESVDYTTFWSDPKIGVVVEYNGNTNSMNAKGYKINYATTLDMAKEISMLQRSDLGKKFRRYFIECERQLMEVKLKPQRALTREQELALKILEGRVYAEELKEYRDIVAIKAIDGNNLILTCGQVVTQLQFNVPNLTTTILNSWLADVLGLGEYKRFGKDKKRTFQPNEAYLKFVSGEGCAMTGKTISSGKITMYYTSSMVARIVKHHMGSLIEYTNAKMIA